MTKNILSFFPQKIKVPVKLFKQISWHTIQQAQPPPKIKNQVIILKKNCFPPARCANAGTTRCAVSGLWSGGRLPAWKPTQGSQALPFTSLLSAPRVLPASGLPA